MKDKTIFESIKAILKLPVIQIYTRKNIKLNETISDPETVTFAYKNTRYDITLNKTAIIIRFRDPHIIGTEYYGSPSFTISINETESKELKTLFDDAIEKYRNQCINVLKTPWLFSQNNTPNTSEN